MAVIGAAGGIAGLRFVQGRARGPFAKPALVCPQPSEYLRLSFVIHKDTNPGNCDLVSKLKL